MRQGLNPAIGAEFAGLKNFWEKTKSVVEYICTNAPSQAFKGGKYYPVLLMFQKK